MAFIRLSARLRFTNVIKLLIFVGCCGFVLNNHPIPARADTIPEIDYAPSSIQNGQSVAINGSGFGVKNPVEPLRYDDFQDGTLGNRLKDQASGGWLTQSKTSLFAHYSDEMQRISRDVIAEQDYDWNNDNMNIGLTYPASLPERIHKFYASFWIHRVDISGDARNSTNMKLWGLFLQDETYHHQPTARVDCYGHLLRGHLYAETYNYVPVCEGPFDMGSWWNREFTDWVRVERYIDTGTVNGNDTHMYFIEDGQTIAATGPGCGSILDSDEESHRPSAFFLGDYWRPDNVNQSSKTYTSEIYADITQARIEIGDTSTWNTNTHREIQIPHTTWVDDQIQFTVNQGAFNNGDPAFLYVVDSNGVVNTTGYPITFAGATGCTPSWWCSDWSACTDSIQTRSCNDDNICGSDDGRPVETADCDSTAPGVVTDLVVS